MCGWKIRASAGRALVDRVSRSRPDVYVMNIDGTHLHPITHNPLWDSAADWGSSP